MLKSAIVAASVCLATAALAQGNTQKSGPGQSEFAPGHQPTQPRAQDIRKARPDNSPTRPDRAILKAPRVSNPPRDRLIAIGRRNKRLPQNFPYALPSFPASA